MPKVHQNQTCGSVISVRSSKSSSFSVSSALAKFSVAGTNLSALQVLLSPIQKFKRHRRLKQEEMSQPVILYDLISFWTLKQYLSIQIFEWWVASHSAALFNSWSDIKDSNECFHPHVKRTKPPPCWLIISLGVISDDENWHYYTALVILQDLHGRLIRGKKTIKTRKGKQPINLRAATSSLIRAISVVSIKPAWRLHHVLALNVDDP